MLEKIAADQVGASADFRPCLAFEANLDFEVVGQDKTHEEYFLMKLLQRFMSDLGLVGCGWAECPARAYKHIENQKRTTNCQIEVIK